MDVRTGLKPKVSGPYRIPEMGDVVYELERSATMREPLGNPEPIEVWTVHFHDPETGRRAGTEFMLFTTQPHITEHYSRWTEPEELGKKANQEREDWMRAKDAIPTDAWDRTVSMPFMDQKTRELRWWTLTV